MDESKYKRVGIISCIIMFVALLVTQSVIDNLAIRRADTKIDALERELADAGKRVEECSRELDDSRRTIEQCHNSVGRIADNFREQSEELQGIIANLKTVREEVQNMENALSFFYIKYGFDDDNPDSNGGELE